MLYSVLGATSQYPHFLYQGLCSFRQPRSSDGGQGRNRTYGVSYVTDLQSADFAIWSHLPMWCGKRESNPQNSVFETDMYANSIIPAYSLTQSNIKC